MRTFAAILFVALAAAPAAAQTVTVSASKLTDGGSPANGTIYWKPAQANGQSASYRQPGGGIATITPLSAPVVDGAFSIVLPDTSLTNPVNVCFVVSLYTTGGSVLGPGYGCVQPHGTAISGGDWCQSGACNFDLYAPSLSSGPTIGPAGAAVLSVGDSDVTGQTASQGAVNLVGTVPATAKYRVSYYANQAAVCGSGTVTVLFTFNWVDPRSARSVSSVVLTIGPAQAPITGSIQGAIPIEALASTAITYTSTLTGSCATGGPASYDAHIAVEEIQ